MANELLTQEELESLFYGASGDVETFDKPEVSNTVSSKEINSLHEIYKKFINVFSGDLSAYLRCPVDIDLVFIEQLSFQNVIASLNNPTCINIFDVISHKTSGFVEMNTELIFSILDRMFGGTGEVNDVKDRKMTDVESDVFEKVIRVCLESLSMAWEHEKKLEFTSARQETNPFSAAIFDPEEHVVLSSMEIRLGDIIGTMNICHPPFSGKSFVKI